MEEKNINENNENPVEENTAPTPFEADKALIVSIPSEGGQSINM